MNHPRVHLIYFSPTGTTRQTLNAIAKGFNPAGVNHFDLTFPSAQAEQHLVDGVAVLGVPVYAGRVPKDFLARMAHYTAEDVPTVLVALYGNREFEDALVELRDVVIPRGFKVIAAGAFIGEHSYATPQRPIAAGRPNAEDLKFAVAFGQKVAAKMTANDFSLPEIAGNVPYRERVNFGGVAPETDGETCILCGRCAEVCPVQVVSVTRAVVTRAENCIMCCACVKSCPAGARRFDHPLIEEKREMLARNCAIAKAPRVFL
jgi:ferredoxin